jgi:hypothetical protein
MLSWTQNGFADRNVKIPKTKLFSIIFSSIQDPFSCHQSHSWNTLNCNPQTDATIFVIIIIRLCILGTQHQWVLKLMIKESGNSSQCGKIFFKPPSIRTHQLRVLAARRRLSNLSDPRNFFLDLRI